MAEPSPVLVTGAAGFFGRAIVRSLTRAGVPVVASDRVDESDFEPREGTHLELVEYVQRDVTADRIDDLLGRAGGIVHAAALTPYGDADHAMLDDLLGVNVEGVCSVLRAVRRAGASRMVFVSSTSVYDQSRPARLDEEDATGRASVYGAAKLAAEILGRRYAEATGIDFRVVRPSALFGAGEIERPSRPRVSEFAQVVGAALRGASVRVERGDSRADWLSVDDAADAVALLWARDDLAGRTFNLSSATSRPFADVVEAVASVVELELAGEDADVVVDGGPDRPAVIANDRIRETLEWEPRRSLEDAVREQLELSRPRSEG